MHELGNMISLRSGFPPVYVSSGVKKSAGKILAVRENIALAIKLW